MIRHSTILLFMIAQFCPMLGCNSPASDADFSKVKLGMSEEEVIAILGKPDKAVTHPQQRSLRMLEWGDDSRVVLENGSVDAVVVNDETILESSDPSENSIE